MHNVAFQLIVVSVRVVEAVDGLVSSCFADTVFHIADAFVKTDWAPG